MKQLSLFIILFISGLMLKAQTPPEKINYQAVARDLSGNPLVNQTLTATYEIRQSSPTGTSVYTETHTGIATNQFGLFTAEIGGGTPSVGTFAGINWGAGLYYLYVEVNGDPMGSSQLLSVPYALYAKQSANGPQGLPGNNSISIVTSEPAGVNCQNGGNKIDVGTDDNNDNILQALEIDFTYFVCNGDSGTAAGDDWGNQVVATQGSNISGDGTTANPLTVINNDNDSTNEFQDLSIAGNTINISNGTGINLSPSTPTTNQVLTWNGTAWTAQNATSGADNWGSQVVVSDTTLTGDGTSGNPLGVNGVLTDNQNLSLTGNSLSLTNDPTPVDLSPFMDNTDAQTLTLASNTLAISNGNSVTLPSSPWAKTGTTLHPAIAGDNVGIGTTASSNKLQVHTATNGVKNLHLTSASTGTTNTDGFEISNDASTTLNMWQKENADWNFNTSSSGSIAISIKSNTNVGIGTSTAMNRLTVAGGTSIGGGYIGNGAPANGLLVEGNVGIGTTSPLVKFHVEENASAVMLLKEVTPTNGAAFVMESLNQYVLLSNESGTFRIENGTTSLQPFNINSTGEVGIGGSAFYSALDVYGKITMRNGATTGYIPVSDANGTMTWTDPNSVISITPSPWTLNGTDIHPVSITNNVGIGTNVPNAQLEVTRGLLGDIQLFPISNTTNPLVINAGGSGGKYFQFNHPNGISMNFGSNGTTGWMGTNSNHDLSIVTNNSIVGTFTTTGNLGIGTTSPNINGATKSITIAASNNYVANRIASLELQGSHNGPNVDIGRVDFNSIGGSINNHARISSVNGGGTIGTSGRLLFHTSNGGVLTEKVRITETGNVGIGTSTPSQKLDVNGTINISSNTGEVNNSAKTGAANLVPIAYGSINGTGTILNAGTGNFSVTWDAGNLWYLITITGESYHFANYITTVTPIGSANLSSATTSVGGDLIVTIYSSANTKVQNSFQFVIFKP